MKTRRKMTVDDREWRRLNKRLHRLVSETDIRTKLKKLHPHTAESEWEEGRARIDVRIDPQTASPIPALVHELFHYWLQHYVFKKDIPYTIEEPMVEALEREFLKFLQGDKRRMDWWRRTVRRELGK